MSDFVSLHVHSEYSLLDGLSTPEEIAEITSSNGQYASAITDHGSMAGILRFQEACEKQNIKGIYGCEFYYVPSLAEDDTDKKRERFHLILLAKNDDGLFKLFRLQRKSWTQGFYYKPRIEFADLEELGGDVICLSGCMGSYLSQLILAGDESGAIFTAQTFQKAFGQDYYVELQPWNDSKLNNTLLEISDSLGIKAVGTIDCHYPTANDRGLEEVVLAVGQWPSFGAAVLRHAKEHFSEAKNERDLVEKMNILYPERRLRFDGIKPYLMSSDEVMAEFFANGVKRQDIFENTLEVADKCSAKLPTKRSLFPEFNKKIDSGRYLRELANLGLEEKGLTGQEYRDRLEEELSIIEKLNFSNYFLVIWDIISWADNNGIARGIARGSVGGSLVAYVLGIIKIDPIKHGLLFERFIDVERPDFPDIDLDFSDKRRHEVKAYMKQRWGQENVAAISTYVGYKPKGMVSDIARVFGVDFNEVKNTTQKFESLEEYTKNARDFHEKYPEILPTAQRLEGRIRQSGAHAAGLVVSSIPLWQVGPIESRKDAKSDERVECLAFDYDEAEKLGLIKVDFLGVKAIEVIDTCIKKIEERHGIDVLQDSLRLDSESVFEQFSAGNTVGVFQAEATAYRELLVRMGCENFNDLAVSNALVRPGAYNTQGSQYVGCKNGTKKVSYPHEVLREVLSETYGTFIYQEQIMKAAQVLAGFSRSEANYLRKIIGKKRDAAEFLPFKEKWLAGCQQYISVKQAEKLWSDLERTAEYMFNKSHAVGYSVTSYQTMWLKVHYPLEFIWSLLTNEDKAENISTYLLEANRLGINVVAPDINNSDISFELVGDDLMFGLSNVSGVGPAATKEILRNRPYSSFEEFVERTQRRYVRTNVIDNLEKVGSFRSIGHDPGYEYTNYYLPILNYPVYAENDNKFRRLHTPVVFEGNELRVVRGLVKTTKRKPNYFRVELEDSSGAASFFLPLDASVRSKDYLIALVAGNTMYHFADAATAEDNFDSKFIEFLRFIEEGFPNHDLSAYGVGNMDDQRSLVYLVALRKFKTKAGKPMASAQVYDPSLNRFFQLTLFNSVYATAVMDLRPFEWFVVANSEEKPGVVNGIIVLDKFLKLKGA